MNENKKTTLRIPDPAGYDPKADASTWPIQRGGQTDVKAFQFVGGIRPPPAKTDEKSQSKKSR